MLTKYRLCLLIFLLVIIGGGCVAISPDLVYYREISPYLQTFDSAKPAQWFLLDGEALKTEMVDHTYQVTVKKEQIAFDIRLLDAQYYDYVRLDTDAVITSSKVDGYWGLLCKGNRVGTEWTEFYRIIIGTNGSAEIDYYNRNQKKPITVLGFVKQHRAIKPGDQANHLQVECMGDEIHLWVNGQHVLSVQDNSIVGGMIGYSVLTDTEPNFQVRFDNYRFARLYPIQK